MTRHGDNYKRMMGKNNTEIGELGPECGHHCGVITVGHHDKHVGHCDCPECHGEIRASDYEVPTNLTVDRSGIDPRSIN